jgi:photosystem II stability/assembly factor-like uncharacterized protein
MRLSALFLMLCIAIVGFSPSLSIGQWIKTNGPEAGLIFALVVKGEDLLAGTYQGGVLRSSDNGENWTDANSGLTNPDIFSLAVMGTDLFAATDGGVFLSPDNGSSWSEVNSGLDLNYGYSSLAANGAYLFAGSPIGGIFRSDNRGASWADVTTTDIDDFLIKTLYGSNGILFAGTYMGSVYTTTNNGASWTAAKTGLPQDIINAFISNGTIVFAGTDSGVFKSSNNGASWTGANDGFPPDSKVRALVKSGASLYAGTKNGVFLTTNNGASWTAINSGLEDSNITALTASGSNLYAGSFTGFIWRLPLEKASVRQPRIPGQQCAFDLSMPGMQHTHVGIRFFLKREEWVDLAVFDVSGRRIASLVRGRVNAGMHTMFWNRRNPSPGVYMVKLQTGAGVQSKNIALSH